MRWTFLLLAACTAPARRDWTDPIAAADRDPIPQAVTAGNARDVVRKCLQRQRLSASNFAHQYRYAFRESGFVHFYDRIGESRDQLKRVYVDYAAVEKVSVDDRFDVSKVSTRWTVTIEGRLRVWEGVRLSYQSEPEPGKESSTADLRVFTLLFDDEVPARALVQALDLLRGK